MNNLEKKIRELANKSPRSGWKEKVEWRRENRDWLRRSSETAFRVLERLDELGWRKADLAREMNVSAQQVSKIVKGEENFTYSTIVKLEKALGIQLLTILSEDEEVVKKERAEYKVVNEIRIDEKLGAFNTAVFINPRGKYGQNEYSEAS
ncbi:helix-turn-helix domain-containing protein [Echinicola soli]|uniref:Helix-turn-helix domain-containing protein n=1 Tax=Echinicola soli TaxID=2591634 RepID=A0A514CDD2_9BACT|nr:helix-turn-helix domain-containing protein [Echinicola soli]QDH77829.1 helix-turn-helix domain-containing protein [Echinicola soli]